MNVPVHGAVTDEAEYLNLVEVAAKAWYTAGEYDQLFCKKLRDYLNVKHVITCNSGSSANLLAVTALTARELGERALMPGDEVITTALNFPTTVNPIIQNGCIPVFVDVDWRMGVDITQLEQAVSAKTKAVVFAHTLGIPFNVKAVRAFCDRYKLWFIEDACDALGGEIDGQKIGTFGDLSTFSFYPAHQITMGEGGAVVAKENRLQDYILSFRDWGRACHCSPGQDNACGRRWASDYDHKYTYVRLGYNLKLTEMQAAVGCAQMDKLPGFVKKRRHNYWYLFDRLASKGYELVYDGCPFGFAIHLSEHQNRNAICQALNAAGVGTRLVMGGNLTRQPAYHDLNYRVIGDLKTTNYIHDHAFWIGCWPGLTTEQLDYAAEKVIEYAG